MDLVDEQDDVTARTNLFQDLLQTFFEVAAITTASDEGTKVECVQLLVGEGFGNVVADDALSKTLDDGGLTDTWFADQYRIVLGTARKNLHDAFHFALTTDDRVELLVARKLGEVATELVEDLATTLFGGSVLCPDGFAFAFASGSFVATQQLYDLLANAREIGAEFDENLGCNAFTFTNETQEDVFGADVVVAQLQRFAQRKLEHLLGSRREGNVTRW